MTKFEIMLFVKIDVKICALFDRQIFLIFTYFNDIFY